MYVGDSALFRDQFGTEEMRQVFGDRMTVQKWLDVEVALAHAEAELGLIPPEAAGEIARHGDAAEYDLDNLKREMDRTSHPIVPLVRAIEAKCDGDAGQYVHWGATTQDIMDTGQVLQIREAWGVIGEELDILEGQLVELARTYRDTPMAGRTHGQQAQPVTFGYKVAVWIAEIRRHRTRMSECASRLFVGQFAGAVGTMAALGDRGPEVHERLMAHLGLAIPNICWHSARDTMAEYASVTAMIAGTMGKIAHEIFVLQKTEVAEVEEPMPMGKVGSSTMPHKRNPAACEGVVALARSAAATLNIAFANLVAEHERDKIGLQAEREYVARLSAQAHAAVRKMVFVTGGLTVKTDAMLRNLDVTGGLTLSEAVMMKLADVIGRQRAHEVVYEACRKAVDSGHDMKTMLLANGEIATKLSVAELDAILDPAAYTGQSAHYVDRVIGTGVS